MTSSVILGKKLSSGHNEKREKNYLEFCIPKNMAKFAAFRCHFFKHKTYKAKV